MKDNPPNDHDRQDQDQVQDYLDMLLTQATERPEAQVNPERESEPQPAAEESPAKVAPSLTMVGGTSLVSAPATSPVHKTTKPFAEPVKPLAFKVPLPTTKPVVKPVVAEPAVTKPVTKPAATKPVVTKPTETKPAVDVATKEVLKQAEVPVTIPTPTPPVPAEEPVVLEPDLAALGKLKEAARAKSIITTEWLENGRPSWAQQQFECLLFSVGGLTLAVPLVELGTIYPVNDELTPIFGQADWFMGLLSVKDSNIRTVNTAKVVMPERYSDTMKEQIRYVISINGVDWGLAVDSVSTAITLEPEAVRWRSARSKRPWLAGTVVEHMCALLDVSQLAAMFVEQDRAH